MLAAKKNLSAVLLLLLLGTSAAYCHSKAVLKIAELGSSSQSWFLPSVTSLRLISLGFDRMLSDFLWLQFIQFVGEGNIAKDGRSAIAATMLDEITSLDPQFAQAYFFTATLIGGEARDPQRADTLLQRGIAANPDNWYIPFIAGVNQYLFAHDETQAARYYKMAAKFPAAPNWLPGQVKILEAKIPSSIKEVNIWQKIYDSTQEPTVKQQAKERLCVLWVHIRDHATPNSLVWQRANLELEKLGVTIFRGR